MVLFRPKLYLAIEYQLSADDFSVSNTTQGDTPSSFAPDYQYFAHTGLNSNLHCKEFRTTVIKLPFFKFAANLDPSECEGRQNARLRVRFDEIFASLPIAGRLFIEWKRKSQSGLRTKDSDEQYVLFFFPQQYEVILNYLWMSFDRFVCHQFSDFY